MAAAGQRVALILLTHGHPDHSAGAAAVRRPDRGAGARAPTPRTGSATEGLAAGDVLTAAGCELRVVATPGHTADSVCLLLPADGALLTGDTVLGRGTTVIAGDGSLADYLGSLRAAAGAGRRGRRCGCCCPATARCWLTRRARSTTTWPTARERLAEVRAALAAGDTHAGADRGPRLRRRGPGAVAVRGVVGPRAARLPGGQRRPAPGMTY